jgi:hypothetical protein
VVNAGDAEHLLADLGEGESSAPGPIEPPKRGRGRPRKDGSSGPSNTTPRRGSAARLSVSQIADKIRAGLTLTAGALYATLPSEYKDYSLREDEIEPLSQALAAEVQMNDKAYKMLTSAAGYSPHIALITVGFQMCLTRYAIWQQKTALTAQQQTRFEPPERPAPIRNDIPASNNGVSAWPGIAQ